MHTAHDSHFAPTSVFFFCISNRFFAISFPNFIMMTDFFTCFLFKQSSFLQSSKMSLTFHIDLFSVIATFAASTAAACRRSDYVTLSNCFRLHAVNLKMSMNLNDRVEEFILNFSFYILEFESSLCLFS